MNELALFARDDKSLPEDGWPWPWDTSSTTDYAYAFDDGKVYASCFGGSWFVATEECPDEDRGDGAVFPNMKGHKRKPYLVRTLGSLQLASRTTGKV